MCIGAVLANYSNVLHLLTFTCWLDQNEKEMFTWNSNNNYCIDT